MKCGFRKWPKRWTGTGSSCWEADLALARLPVANCLLARKDTWRLIARGGKFSPNLRLVTESTELINFDEASVKWCLDNKKILQGPEIPVTMGDSNTGMLAYDVPLNGVTMVVCSNTWEHELDKLRCPLDLDYIEQNFIYVQCNELMYELPYF